MEEATIPHLSESFGISGLLALSTTKQTRALSREDDCKLTRPLFILLIICVFSSVAVGQLWLGSGDANDPYQIWTPADMQGIGADPNYWDVHFKLMADIDLSAYTGTSFNIIGNYTTPFTGVFDGNRHMIGSFTWNSVNDIGIGLFGYVGSAGEIRDVRMDNVSVDVVGGNLIAGLVADNEGDISGCTLTIVVSASESWVGGLAARNQGRIRDCHVTGSVSGTGVVYGNRVGGLVGASVSGGEIEGCSSACTVAGDWGLVGGLVGSSDSTVSNCWSTGDVFGIGDYSEWIGGLMGKNVGTVMNCYSTGRVSGFGEGVGGLVGCTYSQIMDSYSSGNVSGIDRVGGLVGRHQNGLISMCYSTGNVSGNSEVGGLIGYYWGVADAAYLKCFWDSDVNPDVNGIGNTTDPNVIGESTANMQTESTFTDAGWDFVGEVINGPNDVWTICEGEDYPRLAWEKYGGGNGTEANPYLIRTSCQMNAIGADSNYWDAHFILCADINLGEYTGTSFNIIGNGSARFTGIFDGNEHTVSNFTYLDIAENDVGLFGRTGSSSEIKNIHLEDVNITGDYCVGSLVGLNEGLVSNCSITGTVSGCENIGGLVGMAETSSSIVDSTADVTINICDDYGFAAGGLVGHNFHGNISNCSASGSVKQGIDTYYSGGLIGFNEGSVTDCFATCNVSGYGMIGGLIGNNGPWGHIESCYATGNVLGNLAAGGLIGRNYVSVLNCYAMGNVTEGEVIHLYHGKFGGLVGWDFESAINCYSTGQVSGTGIIGAFVGAFDDGEAYTGCFWNSDVNPDVNGIGDWSDPNVIGKTTAEMRTASTFTDAGWDFVGEVINGPNDIWDICEGTNYPKFVWQIPAADFVCPDGVNFIDYAFFAAHWLQSIYGDCGEVELTGDGKVNWVDFALFAEYWKLTGCGECGGADFTGDENVDLADLYVFATYWLGFEYAEVDLTNDGQVGLDDLREFTESWLAGL